MNVLHVCKHYYPVTGGIQKVVRDIVTGVSDADFRILTSRPSGLCKRTSHDDVPVIRTSSLGVVKSTPLSPTLPFRLRSQLDWADLIHYHLPFPVGTIAGLIPNQTPSIVTFHDDILKQGPVVRAYRPFLNWFLGSVGTITVTSPMMRDSCAQISRFSDKVRVIPLGIETDEMPSYDVTLDGQSILFVGRLVDFKGVDVLLAAMKDVDALLTVVGDGPQAADLQQYARSEGVTNSVTFEGYVSDERLERLYRESDVFVLPSKGENESFGIVQLEAMKYGLPVINTDLPTGVPYVSIDGETGLTVPPGNSAALSEAINWLFAHPKEYAHFSRQARDRVLDKFEKSAMLEAISSLYHETLQVS